MHTLRFQFIVFLVALASAFLITFGFGYLQYRRYWNGTIKSVNQKTIDLLINLSGKEIAEASIRRDKSFLDEVLKPIEGKVAIEIHIDAKEAYRNFGISVTPEFHELNTTRKQYSGREFDFRFGDYPPPPWLQTYFQWITHPQQWLSYKYDFITMPFMFFFAICLLTLYALAFWYKARHESNLLKEVLAELQHG